MAKVASRTHEDAVHGIQIPQSWRGQRLDRVLARLFGGHSRSEIQAWIESNRVRLEGQSVSTKARIKGGEWVEVAPPPSSGESERRGWGASPVRLTVRHADEALIVVAKEPGRVVHPAPGHREDTLANGLLYRFPELGKLDRAGIVHRLDRDTSGLLAVARTPMARDRLVSQFKTHAVERRYLVLLHGELASGDRIQAPIARHPRHRTKFAVRAEGKHAVTHFRIVGRYRGMTLVKAWLETGRTHQVRIHMAHIGHPVIGDPLYGGKGRLPAGLSADQRERLSGFPRQALHAERLALEHPATGAPRSWYQPPPEDFAALLRALEAATG